VNKTRINYVNDDWKNVKNKCRTTVNKKYSDVEATDKFKEDILISEHSPIRLLEVDWTWKDIEYWLSTEWSRHKFEKFISTNRDDRTNGDRSKDSQSKSVNFDGFANAQNLIDAFRKRLCGSADPKAQKLALDFKTTLYEYMPQLSEVLVHNCIYRCGCPEFPDTTECKFWDNFVKRHPEMKLGDIRDRYNAYNSEVMKNNYSSR
jgi:hypothetical protein